MLTSKANTGIGKYAKSYTHYKMFGTDKPDYNTAVELLLYSFALSSGYLSEDEITDIDTRILNLTL